MIDWTSGYSASWRVFRVNPETWADASELDGVTDISIERSIERSTDQNSKRGTDSSSKTIEKGSMSVDLVPGTTVDEGYYRFVMVARQGDDTERVEVATLLFTATGGAVNRGVDAVECNGRSVLWPASKVSVEPGAYAPAGVDGVGYAAQLLSDAINAPIVTEGSFVIDEHVVFDNGASVLDAVWAILDAGGFYMSISGDGTVKIEAMPTEPSLSLDMTHARLLHPGIEHQLDTSDVPNVYKVTDGASEAVATNASESSTTSTVTRGWTNEVLDESPVRVNGETLQAYAERKLEEASTIEDSRTYEREWWPGVHPCHVVRGSLASVLLDGDLRVKSQSLACGKGITVTETAYREVHTWLRD